jgi:hypothetical protein
MSDQQAHILALMTRVARTGGEPADRESILQLITTSARESIAGTDSASISTKTDGSYETLAPTDDLSLSADKLQYALGEGPCVDAAGGQPLVRTGELATDQRWPAYGPRATGEVGAVSQMAFEMYSGDKNYGGLNLYSRSPGAFNDEESVFGDPWRTLSSTSSGPKLDPACLPK